MVEVEFTRDNIIRCLCKKCAVQVGSQCVKNKLGLMLLITQQDLDSPMMMEPDKVPGLYCATGKATCKDINTKRVCKCVECPIWNEKSLKYNETSSYFCKG